MSIPLDEWQREQTGRTHFRDMAALTALQGILVKVPTDSDPAIVADAAWRLANAMLAKLGQP